MTKSRFLFLCLTAVIVGIFFTGCKNDLKDFAFTYSMESVDNYKLLVSFNSDKSYKIEEYNYYMDNRARKREPVIIEGSLTDQEFNEIKQLLIKCNFFKMKDSYGFDQDTDSAMGNIMYQVSFKTGDDSKLISIKDSKTNLFSPSFVKLVGYINSFLNTHKKAAN